MADKSKMNKRQTKKLNADQLSLLFAPQTNPVSETSPFVHQPRKSQRQAVEKAKSVKNVPRPTKTATVAPAKAAKAPVVSNAKQTKKKARVLAKESPTPVVAPQTQHIAQTIAAQKPFIVSQAASPQDHKISFDVDKNTIDWSENLARIAKRSQSLLKDFTARQNNMGTPFVATDLSQSFMEMISRLMSNPMHMFAAQANLYKQYLELWQTSTYRLFGVQHSGKTPVVSADKRFKDPVWSDNPIFDYIKQSYLLTARWLQDQVQEVEGIDPRSKKKIDFYTRQFVDALSPSNFALTNPQVIRTTLETRGENLVKGLENLLKDMEKGRIRMTDESAFKVGENIATTPGKVVFENKLIQLIQYTPTTDKVCDVPLLIVPPWINKFYILDLKPENSFIKWAVDQGLTVFCVSWVNPDQEMAALSFEDYMVLGVLTAMDQVRVHSGSQNLNAIGYCLGGTLLASTLAYLHQTNPALAKTVRSATYFVTLVDFKDPGELGVFIDDVQLEAIEQQMNEKGYLEATRMATTFNMLRANDLIWSFVINNYLLGREPFPFDLLYWNSDSTRMPAAMHSFYLRNMYQHNRLIQKNGVKLKGVSIDLTKIKTPTYLLSAREDHITPWESTYSAMNIFKGPVTFTLAGSGHIAGVINPPVANKYNYWTSSQKTETPQAWLQTAKEKEGSWWPHWRNWLSDYAGGLVPARNIEKGLEPAPGRYVKVRA